MQRYNTLKSPDAIKIKNTAVILILILVSFFFADIFSTAMKKKFAYPLNMPAAAEKVKKEKDNLTAGQYMDLLKPIFPVRAAKDGKKTTSKIKLAEILAGGNFQDKVQLLGTISSEDAKVAVLGFGQEVVVIKQGERVGAYRVSEITKHKINLADTTSGEKIVLYLGGTSAGSSSVDVSQSSQLPETSKAINRHEIEALAAPGEILKEIAFIPIIKDDQPYGIKISYINPQGLFSKLGLRMKDTLISINNQSLKSPEDFFKAYQIFHNETSVSLKVDRGGQIVNFNFVVR